VDSSNAEDFHWFKKDLRRIFEFHEEICGDDPPSAEICIVLIVMTKEAAAMDTGLG
jgi:hypothetical protein